MEHATGPVRSRTNGTAAMDMHAPPQTTVHSFGLNRLSFEILWSLGEGAVVFGIGRILLSLSALVIGDDAAIDSGRIAFCLAAGPAYALLAWLLGRFPRSPRVTDAAATAAVPRVAAALFICLLSVTIAEGSTTAADVAWVLSWFALTTGALMLTRRLETAVVPHVVSRRSRMRRAVIVGAGPAALQLIEDMAGQMGHEIDFVGFFDDRQTRSVGLLKRHVPYLGGLNALIDFAAENDEIDVYMALPWTAGARISALLERLRFLPLTVWLVPDPELSALSLQKTSAFDGVVMPTLMTPPFSHWGRIAKNSFDFVAGMAILLLISPILMATAIAIKLDSPGPVFFRQQRSGQYGRKFSIFKFRSLHVAAADAEAATLVSKGDNRVTRVGHYIRKYSIDELPQILNVLRGEMSLVGPRPHAPKAKADGKLYGEVVPDYALRYRVKPGMTGWAQVNGWRGETDTEEKLRKRVEFDFDYIKNWSFWLDMVTLFRTIPAMLFPKNNV
ncbi:MAG: undecaprenyl-phosphate glucose phosphotransferase [Azospirillaceae bacterium]|nr:undecaprenyl-phosphate glucose phosphotransferase [Azospirillaceae bacterium]